MNKTESLPNIKSVLSLIIFFAMASAVVFSVNLATESKQKSTENERVTAIAAEVMPAEKHESVQLMGTDNDGQTQLLAAMLNNGDITGFAAIITVSGNGGNIKVAVGVSNGGVVNKVKIIKSDDITPGFYQSAGSEDYLKLFENVSDANSVGVISGAQTACSAVKSAVNRAIELYGIYKVS